MTNFQIVVLCYFIITFIVSIVFYLEFKTSTIHPIHYKDVPYFISFCISVLWPIWFLVLVGAFVYSILVED